MKQSIILKIIIINTFSLKTTKKITLFTLNNNDLYQELSKNAIFENNSFILNINPDTDVIYIPYKLQIDTEEDEITLIETDTFYYKGKISATDESLIVNKYTKAPINNKEEIITEDLTLSSTTNFKIGVLEGETNG